MHTVLLLTTALEADLASGDLDEAAELLDGVTSGADQCITAVEQYFGPEDGDGEAKNKPT